MLNISLCFINWVKLAALKDLLPETRLMYKLHSMRLCMGKNVLLLTTESQLSVLDKIHLKSILINFAYTRCTCASDDQHLYYLPKKGLEYPTDIKQGPKQYSSASMVRQLTWQKKFFFFFTDYKALGAHKCTVCLFLFKDRNVRNRYLIFLVLLCIQKIVAIISQFFAIRKRKQPFFNIIQTAQI